VGGSPLHLRAVLKDSPAWEAIEAAWRGGGVLAGSSAGAMVLCDPMVDPRGGAFTLGLGLLTGVAVIPAHDHWSEDAAHRTRKMSPPSLVLAGIDERTALIRDPEGSWSAQGAGEVVVFVGGDPADLSALPG
jgi:cyanophycinase